MDGRGRTVARQPRRTWGQNDTQVYYVLAVPGAIRKRGGKGVREEKRAKRYLTPFPHTFSSTLRCGGLTVSVEFLLCYLYPEKDRMVALTMRQPAEFEEARYATRLYLLRYLAELKKKQQEERKSSEKCRGEGCPK